MRVKNVAAALALLAFSAAPAAAEKITASPQDHDEFGSNRSKLINVIDANILARDSREKPVTTFSHPALGDITILRPSSGQVKSVAFFFSGEKGWDQTTTTMAGELTDADTLVLGIDTAVLTKNLGAYGSVPEHIEIVDLSQDVLQVLEVFAPGGVLIGQEIFDDVAETFDANAQAVT